MNRKLLVPAAMVGLIAPALAGCGGSNGGSGGNGDAIVVGTTDNFTATKDAEAPLDPAAAYDIGAWNILRNTFQTLLNYPRTGTDPVPDAAEKCSFTDQLGETYRCSLRPGLQFSNGDQLTSADVKFSVERSLAIKDRNGPSSLLENIDKVETPTANTVVFHLKSPDATFPFKLATPAAAIVDSKVYPADKIYAGYKVVGSGPYALNSFAPDDKAEFVRNQKYKGFAKVNNDKIELRFFKDSDAMEKALRGGSIDLMNRTMTSEQIAKFMDSTSQSLNLVQAAGSEIRYLVFNVNDPSVKSLAVRKAVAQVVDRQALVRDVYARTAEPLYSMVPQGITGHTNSFFNIYGDPSVSAARATLQKAGISTPVPLSMTYTTDHYGAATAKEFAELKRQLEETGLFQVSIQGVPWSSFRPAMQQGKYQVYGMGWFPDYPDPDTYIGPFFGKDNFLGSVYHNDAIEKQLLPRTRQDATRSFTVNNFSQMQDDIARDIPFLPLWQGKQYLVAKSQITGTEWALNSASELSYWELGRGVKN
ncbi:MULTISPECIES: ABC transporter substrate-binding protein [Streptomycetaceae]|uniref:Lipoprotein oligopeptide binding protein n=1 Tax=Streptantibioticus cattleyicolor (strain ATCC 35852 / DSM 46488 / JCM 4925 / NBRC 14057 / NRRL 8057) TaxID=1003195 RepID=F8K2L5_STREN|nr:MULTISPECIES: ABC transporter substrate-binding protein [Streptomycetaceae]AEW97526.1 lipoprotein oligopeptide binding protein [Streptantibioticus cattleyicolor NRRL 8057 = DSM 46488]MYS61959.1 peptide-binding protein [Streptomyces sp. SID5468]CCB77850.1 Lipoprotein oligopeptide binding protein [Streptantibioticus cattleyicolor NRRL 8057 = DSM 46488]